jgi:hypothetical protein
MEEHDRGRLPDDPTPEQIRERLEAIRATWDERQHKKQWTGPAREWVLPRVKNY